MKRYSEEAWHRFEMTGKISDYLAYARPEHAESLRQKEDDHHADRHNRDRNSGTVDGR